MFVQEDSANTYWLNFFYGGICAIPIGIVLTLVGIVRAVRDANLEIPPGITTNADVLDGKSHGRSSLADYHQMPGYAPSTLSSSLPAPEETPLTQPPVLDQELSRRTLLIMVSGLAAEAAIGIIVFKLTRKPSKPITPITPDLFTYKGHTDVVTSVAWSPNGTYIVSTSFDRTAQVWNPLTGKLYMTTKYPDDYVNDAAWSPDSRFIASCGGLTILIWDAITGKVHWTYRSHDQNVNGVAWSPDGMRIASVSESVHVFDAASGRYIYALGGPSDPLWSVVVWSPDSRYLATSPSSGFDVHVCNASTGKTIFVYTGHSAEVSSVAWSPDGQLIASGSVDNTVRIWRLAGVETSDLTVYTYHGHSDSVNQVAWSPDSTRIASASGSVVVGTTDNTVQVWDATTGNHVYVYNGHSGPVTGVSWSPNGKYIASSSVDKTVQVWQAP
jgi:eukaryotic-like serine/threonine-protein kinase